MVTGSTATAARSGGVIGGVMSKKFLGAHGKRYFLCRLCGKVLKSPYFKGESNQMHCGELPKRITDAEARERVEGRQFKGRRKLVGKLQCREDLRRR